MTCEEFEQIVADEFPKAIPPQFRGIIKNVAFIVESEPSEETRRLNGLAPSETLLGYYHGVPTTARGDLYGVGIVLPDTITLYQHPIEAEASHLFHSDILQKTRMSYEECVRKVVRDTIWHEVAHHFGYDEGQVQAKEQKRT